MSYPYNAPGPGGPVPPPYTPPPGPPVRTRWFRRPRVWGLLTLGFLLGLIVAVPSNGGEQTSGGKNRATAKSGPAPTVTATATETVTATPKPEKAEPAPTVTRTKEVKVEVTVTKTAAAAGSGSGSGSDDSGSSDVYYGNCTEARAAGAAPVHRGEPGYGSHLDRDGDGVGCDT